MAGFDNVEDIRVGLNSLLEETQTCSPGVIFEKYPVDPKQLQLRRQTLPFITFVIYRCLKLDNNDDNYVKHATQNAF